MTVQASLCQTWPEPRRPVFSCRGSNNLILLPFSTFLARLYESTGRAIAITPASASASALALASALASALLKMLKFLVKVFIRLYLLNMLMD